MMKYIDLLEVADGDGRLQVLLNKRVMGLHRPCLSSDDAVLDKNATFAHV